MKRKGLSIDQKRERMLYIFHEKKEVFNLKEIEKLGTKAGITLQTVRPVLEELISDNLVETDKIGSANFYWSLPSKTHQTLIIRLKDIDEKIEKLKNQQESIEQSINDSMIDKEPSDERTEKLELLNKLKAEYDKSQKKINWYKRNDPERKEQLEQDQENLKVKTNHWIDQLFEVKKFLMNKGMSDDDIFNAFQIPADIDNI